MTFQLFPSYSRQRSLFGHIVPRKPRGVKTGVHYIASLFFRAPRQTLTTWDSSNTQMHQFHPVSQVSEAQKNLPISTSCSDPPKNYLWSHMAFKCIQFLGAVS